MARSSLDPGAYDFPETLLPSQMAKSKSLSFLGAQGESKSLGGRSKSAQGHFARSISPEKSRAYVRQQQRSLPKMVPEQIRKDLHRYGMPGDGPFGQKNVRQVCTYFEFKGYVEGGEYRAVTVAQFMQIYAFVEARCIDWQLRLAEVNYYHVNDWLIQPATKSTSSSLFEHIADRQQAPTWFLSHWWGEPLVSVMKCLRKHCQMRGLPTHCAYWICAYASRQRELSADFGSDPRRSNLSRAMQLAKFKVLLVLNVSHATSSPAIPFKRLWCIFECSMCADQVSAPVDAALVVPGSSGDEVGMVCSGLTKFERTSDKYLAGRGMTAKVRREYSFPDEIVKASLAFNVKSATTGDDRDRSRILNYIVGQSCDAEPPREHDKYDELNSRMQGLFAQIFWHRALSAEKPTQEEARKKFMAHLGHLSKAIASDAPRKSLSLCLAGCKLDEDDSVQLVARGLPPNLLNLSLNVQQSGLLGHHLVTIATLLPKGLQVLSLDLSGCASISDNDILNFVLHLNKGLKTLVLGLERTQVGEFLQEVIHRESLDMLRERAVAKGTTDPRSKDQQSEDRQTLLESMLRSKVNQEVRDRILVELAAAGQSGDRLAMNRRRDEF